MLRARSAELQSKQVEARSLKPPRKMQNEFWLCDVLVVWKIVDIMTLYHVRTENKNIYYGDGVSSNFLAVMRCLLNFFAVLRCSEPPKVPLATGPKFLVAR